MKMIKKIGATPLLLAALSAFGQSGEVPVKQEPLKIMHAEPLYVDLIRDLGARKGEKEWNVGLGMTDKLNYDSYQMLVEYEFAPVNRLGVEFEVPVTLYSRAGHSESTPSNRVESLKSAVQYTFLVHEKARLSAAVGYLNELDNKHKDHLLADYFRMVDEGVRNLAGTEKAPLVLACVGYYQPIYRQVNAYPFLHASALTGNFDHAHSEQLHREANALLGDYFAEGKRRQLERYGKGAGSGLTSTDLREILDASAIGRVDTLFLRPGAEAWGHFDELNLIATLHDAYQEGDASLVEQAALLTLQHGGQVYPLPDGEALPGREVPSSLAALFRF